MRSWVGLLDEVLGGVLEDSPAPGGVLAVLDGDEVTVAAAGVLDAGSGTPVRHDSPFALGSIGKVYTASAVMAMVDRGVIRLGAQLPGGLAVAHHGVTVRQLLCHTCGLDDPLVDTGSGDDALALALESVAEVPPVHPPGEVFSYTNTGYMAAGRIMELVGHATFEAALKELVLAPAGLSGTTLGEPAQPCSTGHVVERAGPSGPRWRIVVSRLPRAWAPCGATIRAPAADVLAFARVHLWRGRERSLASILTPRAVGRMRTPHASFATAPERMWGLGWELASWGDERAALHRGQSPGHTSVLVVLPRRRLAAALLINRADVPVVRTVATLLAQRFPEIRGLPTPCIPAPAKRDPRSFVGRYRRAGEDVVVEWRGSTLAAVGRTDAGGWASVLDRVGDAEFRVPRTGAVARFVWSGSPPRAYLTLDGGRRLIPRRSGIGSRGGGIT